MARIRSKEAAGMPISRTGFRYPGHREGRPLIQGSLCSMKRFQSLLSAALLIAIPLGAARSSLAASKLNIVTSTQDPAAITRDIGGDRVNVDSIAKGYQDPHFVEPKPSFLLKLMKADLLEVVGLELEIGWLPPLITQSRNARIQVGANGYLDLSRYCEILEIPTGQVTRAMGDVHPLGNPHYWLDPENGRRMAKAIQQKLAELRPEDAAYFAQREADFERRLTDSEKRWDTAMAPYRGRKVITYHRSWPNFAKRFGLDVVDYVEPKPGIPPTPSHTLELINLMKREGIKLILVEPYFDLRTPNAVANAVSGQVLVLLPSVGGIKEVTDYFQLFDYDINLLTTALAKTK
ncbi:MAG: zinc ABC transporter substrate-binding protein [Acidobacteria bacterium]|nr:MAG: zinc ABC transporter substrate-binding protein [Acidobacteriota bacterium]